MSIAKPITPPWTPTPETSPLLKRKDEEAHSIRGLTLSENVLNEHNFMLEPDYDYPLDSMKCQVSNSYFYGNFQFFFYLNKWNISVIN